MENSNWLEHIEILITTPMSHNKHMQHDAAELGRLRQALWALWSIGE
jgi:hypothetical protein